MRPVAGAADAPVPVGGAPAPAKDAPVPVESAPVVNAPGIRCPLCGNRFTEGEGTACAWCGRRRGCSMVACPRCGHEFPKISSG